MRPLVQVPRGSAYAEDIVHLVLLIVGRSGGCLLASVFRPADERGEATLSDGCSGKKAISAVVDHRCVSGALRPTNGSTRSSRRPRPTRSALSTLQDETGRTKYAKRRAALQVHRQGHGVGAHGDGRERRRLRRAGRGSGRRARQAGRRRARKEQLLGALAPMKPTSWRSGRQHRAALPPAAHRRLVARPASLAARSGGIRRNVDPPGGAGRVDAIIAAQFLFNASLRGREEVRMPIVLDADRIGRTLARIAHEILERNRGVEELALVGIRTPRRAARAAAGAGDPRHQPARGADRRARHHALSRRPDAARGRRRSRSSAAPRFRSRSTTSASCWSTTCSTPAGRFARRSTR